MLPLESSALTLRMVFEAGLRPRLVPSLEADLCRVSNEDFSISVDGLEPVEIAAEWATFAIDANDEVTSFRARDRNLYTLEEVLEIASEQLTTLGIGTEKLAEWEARQRAGMREAAKLPGPFIGVGNFSDGKWYGDRNMKAGIKIMSTYQEQAPFTLQYYAQWRSVLSMKTIRREPIQPPAGYEHVSMEPYSSSNDVEREETENRNAESSPVTKPPQPVSKPVPVPFEDQGDKNAIPLWAYVLVVLAILGILFLLVRAFLRGRAS